MTLELGVTPPSETVEAMALAIYRERRECLLAYSAECFPARVADADEKYPSH